MERTLIVGLGNPGPQYEKTRHNIGFMVVDAIARAHNIDLSKNKFNAVYGTGEIDQTPCVLLKPQTFMNLSGRSLVPALAFYQVPIKKVIVIHDELDIPYGQIRLKTGGGHAGHNGLRSIIELTGSADFMRVRMGIGRPKFGDVSSFVLSPFQSEEQMTLSDFCQQATQDIQTVLQLGINQAMNQVHSRYGK
jgi:PTH1 family peptidyl-tRNA hydrolase